MKSLCISLSVFVLMIGFLGPNFEEHQSGPGAFNYWRYKEKGKEKSLIETEKFIKELDRKIEVYIQNNPQRPQWIKENLRFYQTTIEMTKDEIFLLLGEPVKRVLTTKYGANEKWVYREYPGGSCSSEDQFYFKNNVVIKILGFQTGAVL